MIVWILNRIYVPIFLDLPRFMYSIVQGSFNRDVQNRRRHEQASHNNVIQITGTLIKFIFLNI